MDIVKLKECLKTEFGIRNQEEFDMAVLKMKGINLGIFTTPIMGRKDNDTKASNEIAAQC